MKVLYLLAQVATFTGAVVFGFASAFYAYIGGQFYVVLFGALAVGQFALLAMRNPHEPTPSRAKSSPSFHDIDDAPPLGGKRADWSQFK